MIKPNHKIRFKGPFHNRPWHEAIDICIGTSASVWGWQCGINRKDNDDYYMWFWIYDTKLRQVDVPRDLNGYITELCKVRRFVA